MEDLQDKYYTTLGKNLALRFSLNVIESEWTELGKYAWMVAHFVEAESNRDSRESANKAQWDEKRIDTIGANGDGFPGKSHYD
jgi:hypothetical protein